MSKYLGLRSRCHAGDSDLHHSAVRTGRIRGCSQSTCMARSRDAGMTAIVPVLITTFLASAVEAIEMVTIVVGVGATRGWRSTLLGAAAGFVVLVVVVAVFGLALSAIPIGPLRLVIGALLLVFGLQWLRKGVVRVAARGFAGMQVDANQSPDVWTASSVDWTAFVLSFKGVLLEGLEVAFILVSVGAAAGQLGVAVVGGAAALLVVGAVGAVLSRLVARIPRSFLQLVVGLLLTTFGSFWATQGIGVSWPGGDMAIVGLLALYVLTAVINIAVERRAGRRGRATVNLGEVAR